MDSCHNCFLLKYGLGIDVDKYLYATVFAININLCYANTEYARLHPLHQSRLFQCSCLSACMHEHVGVKLVIHVNVFNAS